MTNKPFVDAWVWLMLHDKGEAQHQQVVDFYINGSNERIGD